MKKRMVLFLFLLMVSALAACDANRTEDSRTETGMQMDPLAFITVEHDDGTQLWLGMPRAEAETLVQPVYTAFDEAFMRIPGGLYIHFDESGTIVDGLYISEFADPVSEWQIIGGFHVGDRRATVETHFGQYENVQFFDRGDGLFFFTLMDESGQPKAELAFLYREHENDHIAHIFLSFDRLFESS